MLRIRLRRVGKKKQPMYRIVVADSRAPRDGAFVESIGYYHPLNNPSTIVLDEERAKHWLGHGAQPSERVSKILKIQGIAELPPKLVTRMELGAKRAEEAKAEKAKAEKAAAAEAAAAPPPPPPPPPVAEAPAEPPAAEAEAETSAAEVPAEEPATEEPVPEAEPAAE
jgi:small subunit ribosomal protein S16